MSMGIDLIEYGNNLFYRYIDLFEYVFTQSSSWFSLSLIKKIELSYVLYLN